MATASNPQDVSSTSSDTANLITIGTRRSTLAMIQTDIVRDALLAASPEYTYKVHGMDPIGDRDKITALYKMNAKSLWTSELEALLELGELDMIVHSLKDMPTQMPTGCVLGAIFPREDPRDALVLRVGALPSGEKLSAHEIFMGLPEGSIIGTSSLRRSAQMKRKYPHLKFDDVRGNVPTRLRKLDDPKSFTDQKVPEFAAIVIAVAGLVRLDLGDRITAHLSKSDGGMMHAVGQGAIGVECREGDAKVIGLLEKLGCWKTERACLAERSLMRILEGGCSVPLGVESSWADGDELTLDATVVSIDGNEAVEGKASMVVKTKEDSEALGREVAKIMVEKGAGKILEKITLNRHIIEEQGQA